MDFEPSLPPWYKPEKVKDVHKLTQEERGEIIEQAFSKIRAAFKNYEDRQSQVEISKKVLEGFVKEQSVVIEAGTGIGKSLAYLCAALSFSFIRGARVLVSTETKNLQLQVFSKELPFLKKVLASGLNYSLTLGSGNYLCKLRYEESLNTGSFQNLISEKRLKSFGHWVKKVFENNEEGHIYDAPDFVSPHFWSLISRSSDSCPASKCTYFKECNYYKTKAKWQGGRILVANHHLVLFNLQNDKNLIPQYEALILDEAHGFLDTAYSIFSLSFQLNSLTEQKKVFEKYIVPNFSSEKVEKEFEKSWNSCERMWNFLFSFWQEHLGLHFEENYTKTIQSSPSKEELDLGELRTSLFEIGLTLETEFKNSEDALTLNYANGAGKFISRVSRFVKAFSDINLEDVVYWASVQKGIFSLNACSIGLGNEIEAIFEEPQLWISATLGYWSGGMPPKSKEEVVKAGYFNNFIRSTFPKDIQIEDLICDIYKSTFSYQKKSILYIPDRLSTPPTWGASEHEKDAYEEDLLEELVWLSKLSKGGVLILFTSYYLLNKMGDYLSETLDYPIISQSRYGAAKALELFKEDEDAVLLGTSSFWQGVDVPGSQLRMLIITKLMFQPPDDPIFKARSDKLKQQDRNPFLELAMPYAATMLRQGFGRLIRTQEDKGVVALLDSRTLRKSYGTNLLINIPKAERAGSREVLQKKVKEKKIYL